MNQQLPITPPAGSKSNFTEFKTRYQQPTQSSTYPPYISQPMSQPSTPYSIAEKGQSMGMKRPPSRDIYPDAPKKSKVLTYPRENTDEQCENIPPEMMDEFFYNPLN